MMFALSFTYFTFLQNRFKLVRTTVLVGGQKIKRNCVKNIYLTTF